MWIVADTILTMAGGEIKNHVIMVQDGRIADIVHRSKLPSDADILTYKGGIAFPAFVNMHTHLQWSGFRGIGDYLGLMDWIYKRIVKIGLNLTEEQKRAGIELGIKRSYAAGITTVLDAHFDPLVFNIAREKGMRGIYFLEGFGIYSRKQKDEIKRVRDGITGMLKDATSEFRVGFSPHAPYTVTPEVLMELLPWARKLELPIMTHLAETSSEREYFAYGGGDYAVELNAFPAKTDLTAGSPVGYCKKYNLFGPDVFFAHCVDINPNEMDILAAFGAKVVTCPGSNAILAAGIAPVKDFLDKGIEVFLGTDSEASCVEFDMFEEMRRLILFSRLRTHEPVKLNATTVLEMCTSGAASAAGFKDIGIIEIGKSADIVVATPDIEGVKDGYRRPHENLVWGAHKSDIQLVLSRGKIVYEKK